MRGNRLFLFPAVGWVTMFFSYPFSLSLFFFFYCAVVSFPVTTRTCIRVANPPQPAERAAEGLGDCDDENSFLCAPNSWRQFEAVFRRSRRGVRVFRYISELCMCSPALGRIYAALVWSGLVFDVLFRDAARMLFALFCCLRACMVSLTTSAQTSEVIACHRA